MADINAKNAQGETELHKKVQDDDLPAVTHLLSKGADVNVPDNDGNTPLHKASGQSVLQALLAFGGNTHLINSKNENPRHIVATSSFEDKDEMLYILHAVGSPRCKTHLGSCTEGCAPDGNDNGKHPCVQCISRDRHSFDDVLENVMLEALNPAPSKGGRILCMDGGGMKGLVLIQILMAIQDASGGRPILELFDWIAGTSTGGILALTLASGKTPRYTQGLCFRLKDAIFPGDKMARPYDEKPLEDILKKELGAKTVMTDIKGIKVFVTATMIDRSPADLHLFRNYESPEQLAKTKPDTKFNFEIKPPNEQLAWKAGRATGAAPYFYKALDQFVDGALVANNPTLDVLTEIEEYRTILRTLNQCSDCPKPGVVVSLGTGRSPVTQKEVTDFEPDGIWNYLLSTQIVASVGLVQLLVEQACMSDNRTVDRARAVCSMSDIPYFRLSPQLSQDVELDEKDDEILVKMMWETMVYIKEKKEAIQKLANLLTHGL